MEKDKLKLGMIGAGFISRFQSVTMEQVRNMEITNIKLNNQSRMNFLKGGY